MIKLNCYQLRSNSDHKGWLHYLREELNVVKSSQTNFELNLNRPDVKWKWNYLILKHELLYFYSSDDDEQQPCRIINLPTFDLDDDLEFRSGMHVIKIKSQKYRFYFASNDFTSLNEWITKFKAIFNQKKNDESITKSIGVPSTKINEPKTVSCKPIINSNFKPNSTQYRSFNGDHQGQLLKPKNFKHAYSFRDLNLDSTVQNGQMSHLNGLISKSTAQIMMSNQHQRINSPQADQSNENQLFDDQQIAQTLGTKYFNNGSYLRSQSCVDSNLLNKYTKARLMNRELKDSRDKAVNQMSSSDNFSSINPILPPSSRRLHQTNQTDFNSSFNQQNQINQFNEQNQLNKQQEQLNQKVIKKEIPKPQPRISKMKEQNANFVGKIINEFDELSKQCEKQLEHYSSLRKRNGNTNSSNHNLDNRTVTELNKINSNFNSYPRNLTSTAKKENAKNFDTSTETKYLSVLDREYNRLFKEKNPPTPVKPSAVQTATSKEIQSIYLKQHDNPNTINNNNNSSLSDKCNSPISDHSLSSSSGISSCISSYYSMGQDVQTAYSSSTNFSFSPNSKNSSFESQITCADKPPPSKTNEKNNKKDKQVQRKSSFNSFRLFGSSKVLSKLSSSAKTSPEDDQKAIVKNNKGFLTSPRVKRSFFGLRKTSTSLPATNTTAVQTDELNQFEQDRSTHAQTQSSHLNRIKSKSSELLNDHYMDHSHQTNNRFNKPELLQLTNKLLDYEVILPVPQTPETPRKPTMGVSAMLMTNKRRSSSVSCDRIAIEHAFQIYNEKIANTNSNRVP